MMKPIRTFQVVPALPAALEPLRAIAYNLRWEWDADVAALFHRLDADLWERTGHNPVLMLGLLDQARAEAAAADDAFLSHLERVRHDLDAYLAGEGAWYRQADDDQGTPLVAYFSAEFGVTACLPIFAGGLGVLAGDHLKSASDLGVPLVAVGLLYQQGYFHQYLNAAGWQQEAYQVNDFHNLPLTLERDAGGSPVLVDVPMADQVVRAQVWRAQVGRVALYLLDTNLPENLPHDRDITDQLYGGDIETRIRQEIVLGIGGYRALEKLGIEPSVYHMNEGHSAFLALERIRRLMEQYGVSFAVAAEAASAGLVFTSHTPVPAGHDYFPPELMTRYLGDMANALRLPMRDFLGLGRQNPGDDREPFCMTILALKLASYSNGVSKLHGEVTRRMWQGIWPGVPVDEIPIGHVTNGVHLRSWVSNDLAEVYDRYLGAYWREEPDDQRVWRRVAHIPMEELWRTHERRRQRLVAFARARLRQQLERRGATRAELDAANEVLQADALTIGFGRRFAAYKRATLLLRDPERLARILTNPERPVQVIFAGKAHPRDEAGKALIQQIVSLSREEPFRRRIVFLEDYDIAVADVMVQGADVWLNNPRRPLEASGTSGMKAAANGSLNVSTLDGWWAEAWDAAKTPIGWAIGRGEVYDDPEEQDRVEAEALYELLEHEVIPTFYERDLDGLPRRWVERMKSSVGAICPVFNTDRMVWDYHQRFYEPGAERFRKMAADDLHDARELAVWKQRVRAAWPQVAVEEVDGDTVNELPVGSKFQIRARIRLGELTPSDVVVQLYLGRVASDGSFLDAQPYAMRAVSGEGGRWVFEATAEPCCSSGRYGYTVRVLPCHPALVTPFVPGLIRWADDA